jgi:hypothetical protein
MDQFARIVVGYHGCTEQFARDLLLGSMPISTWQPSANDWDWLGHGSYFWEHSPERALRWAKEKLMPTGEVPAVIGALIQLGRCFDLLNESITRLLSQNYQELAQAFGNAGIPLPQNLGKDHKRRELDCLVINDCLGRLRRKGIEYDTVRGAFLEGDPAYPGGGFSREAHIQLAVRNLSCILGVFRPS